MKKKLLGFIILCLLILIVAPNLTKAAESPAGLMDGKAIGTSTNSTTVMGSTLQVTDNNELTSYPLIYERSDSSKSKQDTFLIIFDSPVTINSYKMFITNYNREKMYIVFEDSNGVGIEGSIVNEVIQGDNEIHSFAKPLTNVKKIWVIQKGTGTLNVAEFNLYNIEPTPTITPTEEPVATPTVEPTATPEPTIEPTSTVTPTPSPTVSPSPTPEQPTGDRAIMVVTMSTGLEKEFDLSMEEVNTFIAWYEQKQAGTGTASYAINKHENNKGPFTNRKDYVIFDKILTFSVDQY
ncbi:hypothetical protein [Paenibacillus albidus]|uniref:hypothetical protein n=1 Tax=Paenibacillus albidus TaxID=2041023 RepID=UPI001E49EA84|nr:hypothetical protein [Paenibacillus albidus]